MYAEMAQWFERSAPEPELGVQLQAGTLNYYYYYFKLLFCFCFCFVLCCFIRTGHRKSD